MYELRCSTKKGERYYNSRFTGSRLLSTPGSVRRARPADQTLDQLLAIQNIGLTEGGKTMLNTGRNVRAVAGGKGDGAAGLLVRPVLAVGAALRVEQHVHTAC